MGRKNGKKRYVLFSVTIVVFAALFLSAVIYAQTKAPDVITMKNKAYKKHKAAIIEFHHLKHQDEYVKKHPAFFKNGCGECHHDDNNKPLKNLKVGDPVQGCIECHKKPGEMPSAEKKEMRKAKLKKEEQKKKKLEYHAEALHYNCEDCHRAYNKKNKLKSKDKGYAPTSCVKCHEK